MSNKRILEFNALPETARRRVLACVRQVGDVKPLIVHEDVGGSDAAKWGVAAAAGVAWLGYIVFSGFGESVDGPGSGYGLACALIIVGVLLALRPSVIRKRAPFADGLYLLPLDLLTVEGGTLTLNPLIEVTGYNAFQEAPDRTRLTLTFVGGDVKLLYTANPQAAERVVQAIAAARNEAAAAMQAGDMSYFSARDPFYDARVGGEWDLICANKNPKASAGPVFAKTPIWLRAGVPVGVVVGIGLGIGIQTIRDRVTDDAMFEKAKSRATVDSLNIYMNNGGERHLDEVQNVLMPRAELDVVLREGSVTSLRNYRERYPDGPNDAEAKEAIHALFAEAFTKLEAAAGGNQPEIVTHMRALFDWLEVNDSPPIDLRFQPPDPALLVETDKYIQELTPEELDGITVVPISPSFGPERSQAREQWIASQLGEGFHRVVPADILDLQTGEPIATDAKIAELTPQRATIAVSYIVDSSGSLYSSDSSTKSYVGIAVYFAVTMFVPGAPPLSFVLSVAPPSEFMVTSDGIQIDPSDYLVYDVMAKKAYEELAQKLGGALYSANDDSSDLVIFSGEVPDLAELLAEAQAEAEAEAEPE